VPVPRRPEFGRPRPDRYDRCVKLTPSGLLEHAKSDEGRKQLRYAGISVVFVPLGQAFVQILKWVFDVHEVLAVLISACILTLPNYLANNHIVWRHKNKDNQATEITVFWLAAVLGTAFAMGFVFLAAKIVPEDKGEVAHAIAIFAAQLLGYGIVWVARYLFLDRLIFKATHHGEEPPPELLDDLHRDFPV
jgi:putative flippase GtrA